MVFRPLYVFSIALALMALGPLRPVSAVNPIGKCGKILQKLSPKTFKDFAPYRLQYYTWLATPRDISTMMYLDAVFLNTETLKNNGTTTDLIVSFRRGEENYELKLKMRELLKDFHDFLTRTFQKGIRFSPGKRFEFGTIEIDLVLKYLKSSGVLFDDHWTIDGLNYLHILPDSTTYLGQLALRAERDFGEKLFYFPTRFIPVSALALYHHDFKSSSPFVEPSSFEMKAPHGIAIGLRHLIQPELGISAVEHEGKHSQTDKRILAKTSDPFQGLAYAKDELPVYEASYKSSLPFDEVPIRAEQIIADTKRLILRMKTLLDSRAPHSSLTTDELNRALIKMNEEVNHYYLSTYHEILRGHTLALDLHFLAENAAQALSKIVA